MSGSKNYQGVEETPIAKIERLLDVADAAFKNQAAFEFPDELHSTPAVIIELASTLGLSGGSQFPLWRRVVSINRKLPRLKLRDRLEQLFKRAARVPPGPLAQLWLKRQTGNMSVSEAHELDALDHLLSCVPRDVRGNLAGEPVPFTHKGVSSCAELLHKHPSPVFKILRDRVAHTDKATSDLLTYAAFLDFYCRSRDWMERYDQPLRELIRLAEELGRPALWKTFSHLLRGNYPGANEIKKIQTRHRVKKHRNELKMRYKV